MANRLIIFLVFVHVLEGSFASSSVESVRDPSDVELAQNKTTEAWNRAMDVIFTSIDGNLSSNDGRDQYLANLMKGVDYYVAVAPSLPQSNASHDEYVKNLKTFISLIYDAVDMATFKNGSYFKTLIELNSIRNTVDFVPVVTSLLRMSGSSSIPIQTKIIYDLGRLYANVFGAIASRIASNFGYGDGDQSAFKDGAIAAVKDISDDVYASLKNKT